MSNSRQRIGSRNRYDAEILTDLRKEMSAKLDTLRAEQGELVAILKLGFDNEVFRKLNIVNHRIEVATIRHKGDWMHGSYPQYVEMAK